MPLDNTAVLIAYTRTGDANLDGFVNDNDATILGATYAPAVANSVWALADFDFNGFVDDDDATLLGAFYDPFPGPLAAPIERLVDQLATSIAFDIGVALPGDDGRRNGRRKSASADEVWSKLLWR